MCFDSVSHFLINVGGMWLCTWALSAYDSWGGRACTAAAQVHVNTHVCMYMYACTWNNMHNVQNHMPPCK